MVSSKLSVTVLLIIVRSCCQQSTFDTTRLSSCEMICSLERIDSLSPTPVITVDHVEDLGHNYSGYTTMSSSDRMRTRLVRRISSWGEAAAYRPLGL